MDKLMLFFQLFQKGREVANVEKWKAHQITGTAVGALLIVLMKLSTSLGYALPFNETDMLQLGGAIVAIFNIVLTFITSKRVGVSSIVNEPTAVAPVVSQPLPPPFDPANLVVSAVDELPATRTVAIPEDTSGDIAEIQVRTVKRRNRLPVVPEAPVQPSNPPAKPGDTYYG